MAPIQAPSQRILSVDATRGFAMAFVCLSHFSWSLEEARPQFADMLQSVAMIASPTFLLLSGAMLGLLQLRRANALPALASRLFHRGLFILVVGHLIMSGASAMAHGKNYWSVVVDRVYITDVVGLCLMLLPRLTFDRGVGRLVTVAVVLYLGSMLVGYVWQPATETGVVFEQMLFGSHGHSGQQLMEFASPVIPYVALYIGGIGLGSYLNRVASGGLGARETRRIVVVAVGMVLLACLAKAGWMLAHMDKTTLLGGIVHDLTSPFQKIPPSPAYLLFFPGLGVLVLSVFFAIERARPGAYFPVRLFGVIGQASFFVFIVQFYVFGPMSMHASFFGGRYWYLSYLGAMVGIWSLALAWGKFRGNRLFDITYTTFHDTAPKPATGSAAG